jgi:beta-galactosidase
LAGTPKDRYYLYRARWNTAQPTLHLLPHWTWPGREGQTTPVFAYTSYPSAELFVNGQSQGRQTKGPSNEPQSRYRLMWNDVKYAPGTLKIVAYDAQGKAVATKEVKTAGAPHHIKLVADRMVLAADGKDLSFITARVEDAQGNLCPDAAQSLSFAVSGAGSFRAIGNGDATSLESFQKPQMRVFQGQLVAIVQTGDKAGAVQVKASGTGLQAGTVTLQTKASSAGK